MRGLAIRCRGWLAAASEQVEEGWVLCHESVRRGMRAPKQKTILRFETHKVLNAQRGEEEGACMYLSASPKQLSTLMQDEGSLTCICHATVDVAAGYTHL